MHGSVFVSIQDVQLFFKSQSFVAPSQNLPSRPLTMLFSNGIKLVLG